MVLQRLHCPMIGIVLIASFLAVQGCTAFKEDSTYRLLRDNARLYDRTAETITPQATWSQTILFPIALPLAYTTWIGDIALFITDSVIVNPPRFFWRGFGTGWDWVWEKPVEGTPYRRAVVTSFRVIITPIAIGAACVSHALFTGKDKD